MEVLYPAISLGVYFLYMGFPLVCADCDTCGRSGVACTSLTDFQPCFGCLCYLILLFHNICQRIKHLQPFRLISPASVTPVRRAPSAMQTAPQYASVLPLSWCPAAFRPHWQVAVANVVRQDVLPVSIPLRLDFVSVRAASRRDRFCSLVRTESSVMWTKKLPDSAQQTRQYRQYHLVF